MQIVRDLAVDRHLKRTEVGRTPGEIVSYPGLEKKLTERPKTAKAFQGIPGWAGCSEWPPGASECKIRGILECPPSTVFGVVGKNSGLLVGR
jgi:hypothetical protein